MSDPNEAVKKRQYWIVGSIITCLLVAAGVGFFLYDPIPPSTPKSKPISMTTPGSVSDKEVWQSKSAADIQVTKQKALELEQSQKNVLSEQVQTKERTEKLERVVQEQQKLIEAMTKNQANSSPTNGKTNGNAKPESILVNPLYPNSGSKQVDGSSNASTLNTPLNEGLQTHVPERKFEILNVKTTGTETKNKQSSKGGKGGIEFLPASTFVRVYMLNGVDAPTGGAAQSNPLPLALHVLDPANLPSKFKLDIRDCRFMSSAFGDISAERTMARLETLSCTLKNGESIEMAVKGQVIGEDGKVGLRGRLVTKQGQQLANALLAGTATGIGQAFNQAASISNSSGIGVTSTIDPNKVAQAAIGNGISNAGNTLAQYYIKQASGMYPVIETDGGRIVEVMITKGAVYTGSQNIRETFTALNTRSDITNTRGQNNED